MYSEIALFLVIFVGFGFQILNDLVKNKKQTERMNELEGNIAVVLKMMLEKVDAIHELKDYIPQFSINQNPLQGLFDAIASNMQRNIRPEQFRDEAGQYSALNEGEINATEKEQK